MHAHTRDRNFQLRLRKNAMIRGIVLVFGVALIGLGSAILSNKLSCSVRTGVPLSLRQKAKAHALEVALRLNKLVGPDGFHIRVDGSSEFDENGIAYRIEYRRGETVTSGVWYEEIVVRGAGPDGLWETTDDIVVRVMIPFARH
jgi:hypothetical protein